MIIDSHEHIMFPAKMQLDKMDEPGVDKAVFYSVLDCTRRKQAH